MSDTELALIVGGVLLAVAAGYALSCWVWPFTVCWACEGSGRRARGDGRVWRSCRWCRGMGRRLRFGRWLHNRASRLRRGR